MFKQRLNMVSGLRSEFGSEDEEQTNCRTLQRYLQEEISFPIQCKVRP